MSLSPLPASLPSLSPLPPPASDRTPGSPSRSRHPGLPAVRFRPGGVGRRFPGAACIERGGPAASPPRPGLLLGRQLWLHGAGVGWGVGRWPGAWETRWDGHRARPLLPGEQFLSGGRRHCRRHLPGFENGGRAAASQSEDIGRLLGNVKSRPFDRMVEGTALHASGRR